MRLREDVDDFYAGFRGGGVAPPAVPAAPIGAAAAAAAAAPESFVGVLAAEFDDLMMIPECSGMLTEVPARATVLSVTACTSTSATTSQGVRGMLTEVPQAQLPQASGSGGLAGAHRTSPQGSPVGSACSSDAACLAYGAAELASALMAGIPDCSGEQCEVLLRLLDGAATDEAAEFRRIAARRLSWLRLCGFRAVATPSETEDLLDAIGAEDEADFECSGAWDSWAASDAEMPF